MFVLISLSSEIQTLYASAVTEFFVAGQSEIILDDQTVAYSLFFSRPFLSEDIDQFCPDAIFSIEKAHEKNLPFVVNGSPISIHTDLYSHGSIPHVNIRIHSDFPINYELIKNEIRQQLMLLILSHSSDRGFSHSLGVSTVAHPRVFQQGLASLFLLRACEKPQDRAIKIGLSGGIGSGKSTVASIFRDNGAVIADADAIARNLVLPESEGLACLVEVFGTTILDKKGSLDRKKLASIVFSDSASREKLESILHPRIALEASSILSRASAGTIALYDVPLLIEQNLSANFDCVVIVTASEERRLERLKKRGVSEDHARARMKAQATLAQRRAGATIWIENEGGYDDLRAVVNAFLALWSH